MRAFNVLGGLLSFSLALSLSPVQADTASHVQADTALNIQQIEHLTGVKGKWNAQEQVFRVAIPRDDIQASVAGSRMVPALGLTAWAAFTPMPAHGAGHSMVMGDMVLTEDQVFPVMKAALESGLEVTALHNHFLWDQPKVMFMHIGGMGTQQQLAGAVGQVFRALKASAGGKGWVPSGKVDPAQTQLDIAPIEKMLSQKAEASPGVYKFSFGRTATMHGLPVGNAMGVNTWAAFAGTDAQAIVDGDFAVREAELQPVLKALVEGGIAVVAIHQHMTFEQPRYIFLHYWGVGPARKLAGTLRGALDLSAEP